MIITIVNMSELVADDELQGVIRAINRQINEDFEPYWSLGATLRLEGKSKTVPDKLSLPDMRGDAVLYLWDEVDVDQALGYHDMNARGIPFGFVFTKLAKELGEQWTVTLSHEALELIADPLVNLLVAGPHPEENRIVFHWYEMSDAVQSETYKIDGIEVSNFLLPLYFTPDAEPGSRNDFLGRPQKDGKTLPSFGVNAGGYIGFFDPKLGKHVTYANAADKKAKKRLKIKKALATGRRSYRTTGWPREAAAGKRAAAASPGVERPVLAREPVRSVASKCGRHFARIDDDAK